MGNLKDGGCCVGLTDPPGSQGVSRLRRVMAVNQLLLVPVSVKRLSAEPSGAWQRRGARGGREREREDTGPDNCQSPLSPPGGVALLLEAVRPTLPP